MKLTVTFAGAFLFVAEADAQLASVPTQSELNVISDKCGTPRSTLRLIGKDQIHINPRRTEKYERVDCVLAELKRRYPTHLNMGFVGNEAPDPKAN